MSLPPDLIGLAPGLTAETVEALAVRSVRRDSVASFQALLAAVREAVGATLGPVRDAEAAALSLRQRETVRAVAADLGALVAALDVGVSAEARCLSRRRPSDRAAGALRAVLRPSPGWLPRLRERAAELAGSASATCPTWVAGAGAAVEALGQTASHVATLGAAQPAASSARVLADRAAAALRAGRDALLADVAKLVD